LFVVMSAVVPAAAVDQIARALAPHPVLIHHDFTQLREFAVSAPNASFVPDPKIMGWGVWGFSAGVFHALRHATQHFEFDYLQLLSSSCLPIKSMAAFETHIATSRVDSHLGSLPVKEDLDVLMSVGWRAYAPQGSFRQRAMRRLSRAYFGGSTGRRDEGGIWLHSGAATGRNGHPRLIARLAEAVYRLMANPRIGRHIFDDDFSAWFGSTWFGAKRPTIEAMLALFDEPRTQRYFERIWSADEFIIPSLVRKTGAVCGPPDVLIGRFDEARPKTFDVADFRELEQSPAFFARKFPGDAGAPIRQRVLKELVGGPSVEATVDAEH
jgi:hypothetical protein